MSHIVGLRIKNFACYRGDQAIKLGPGCYAITAEHISDKTRSNWLGKSTLEHAIRWCLFGKVPNDSDTLDDLITIGESDVRVDIEMSDGSVFSREKIRGNKSATFKISVPGVKENLKNAGAQEKIEELLGLTEDDMLTSCWSEQGELPAMIKATSGTLTKMVEQWLGEDLEKLIAAGADVSEGLNKACEDHKAAVDEVDRLKKFEPLVMSYEVGIPELEKELERQKKDYAQAQKDKGNWALRGSLTTSIRELEVLKKAEVEVSRPFTFKEPELDRLDILEKKAHGDRDELKKHRDQLRARAVDLRKLVKGEFDGCCPVSSGFKCPAKDEINEAGSKSRASLESLEKELSLANGELQNIEAELEDIHQTRRRRSSEELDKSQREGKKSELTKRIKSLETTIHEHTRDGIKPISPGESPPDIPPIPDNSKLEMARLHQKQAREAIEALPEAHKRVSETADEVRAHRLALSILGPEGARKKVCQGVVNSIEADANQILTDAGIELYVKAAWGRETKELAEQCYECGNAYPVSAKVKECVRCGSPRGQKIRHEFRWKLSNVSGAAKGLGGMGTRTAGYRWLKKKYDVAWSVAFLDEVASELDTFHRRAVSASIRKMLVGTFEQSFLTAHDAGSLEACDKRILITSDGKYSKIKVIS